jgi:predicted transcriptional regulator
MEVKTAKRESAELVRSLLEEAGLNQCEAARLIGVSPRTMRRYVSLHDESAVEMPPPTRSLLYMLTDQLRAARLVRRQRRRQTA